MTLRFRPDVRGFISPGKLSQNPVYETASSPPIPQHMVFPLNNFSLLFLHLPPHPLKK